MANFVTLTTKRVARFGDQLRKIDEHNRRTDPKMAQTANPARTHLNRPLAGDRSVPLYEAVWERMEEAGVSLPDNSDSIAQELILSASPEYFRPQYHRDDPAGEGKYEQERMEKWADLTMDWLNNRYGKNLVSAELHLDEQTPHIHAVIVPIAEVELKKRRTKEQIRRDNKILKNNPDAEIPQETYKKVRWNRTAMFGRAKHFEMQAEYGKHMAPLKLVRGIPKKLTGLIHKSVKEFHRENYLKTRPDQTQKTSFDFEEPKFRKKKKLFESTNSFINQILKAVAQSNEANRKELNKRLREAEDAKVKAEKSEKQRDRENREIRQKLGVLAGMDHNEIMGVLEHMEIQQEQAKEARQEIRKQQGHTLPSPGYEPS